MKWKGGQHSPSLKIVSKATANKNFSSRLVSVERQFTIFVHFISCTKWGTWTWIVKQQTERAIQKCVWKQFWNHFLCVWNGDRHCGKTHFLIRLLFNFLVVVFAVVSVLWITYPQVALESSKYLTRWYLTVEANTFVYAEPPLHDGKQGT